MAATPVASQIEVDIDPTVSSGAIFDRFDLLLHGRAVSSTPVEEVALKLDDAVIGRVEYGAMDSAVQGVLPEDGNRTQYVFYLNVQMPRAEAQRKCACILAVRTSDGRKEKGKYIGEKKKKGRKERVGREEKEKKKDKKEDKWKKKEKKK